MNTPLLVQILSPLRNADSQQWGWACEKVIAIRVVTADGKILLCNKDQHSELLWAAQGAGPGMFQAARRLFALILGLTIFQDSQQLSLHFTSRFEMAFPML